MAREALSQEHIGQLKQLLEKFEALRAAHLFTPEEAKAIQEVVETFETHGAEIRAIIERERASQMWAKVRLKFYLVLKWLLGSFLALITAFQAYQQAIAPMVEKWWSK